MDKKHIARELRSAIERYVDYTIKEHTEQVINNKADKAWNKITDLINLLTESSDEVCPPAQQGLQVRPTNAASNGASI